MDFLNSIARFLNPPKSLYKTVVLNLSGPADWILLMGPVYDSNPVCLWLESTQCGVGVPGTYAGMIWLWCDPAHHSESMCWIQLQSNHPLVQSGIWGYVMWAAGLLMGLEAWW